MSDSEDDFHSADEGDDESLNSALNQDIRTSKSEDISNSDTPSNNVSLVDEETTKDIATTENGDDTVEECNGSEVISKKEPVDQDLESKVHISCKTTQNEEVTDHNDDIATKSDINESEPCDDGVDGKDDPSDHTSADDQVNRDESVNADDKNIHPDSAQGVSISKKSDKLHTLADDTANENDQDGDPPISSKIDTKQADSSKPEIAKDEDESQETNDWNSDDWGWETSLESAVESATSAVTSVFHTFEKTLGIPDPAQMAKVVVQEEKLDTECDTTKEDSKTNVSGQGDSKSTGADINTQENQGSWFSSGWGSWGVSSISSIVQTAGKDLVTGSLDTLEYIGKKTIDVISEGDPGIRSKTETVVRPFLSKTSTLSEVLQEAKRSQLDHGETDLTNERRVTSFRDLLDQFEGFTYLEALEMLSNECEQKLQRILKVQSEEALRETKSTLLLIKNNFEPSEDKEDTTLNTSLPDQLKDIVKEIKLAVNPNKLINSFEKAVSLTQPVDDPLPDLNDYYHQMMTRLAEVTCRSMELIHKVSELILLPDFTSDLAIVTKATKVKEIVDILKPVGTSLSSTYAEQLNDICGEDNPDFKLAESVTELHLEGSNCFSFLDDCHRLLLPILQLAAIK